MAFQTCSVCGHPEHTKINQSLAAGTQLRIIAAQFQISKSSLSRHGRKCLARRRENKNKMAGYRVPIQQCEMHVVWPGQTISPQLLSRDDVVFIKVEYEPRGDYYGRTDEEGRYLNPSQAYAVALRENEKRDACREKPSESQPAPDPNQ
jgi:hypothetical protein